MLKQIFVIISVLTMSVFSVQAQKKHRPIPELISIRWLDYFDFDESCKYMYDTKLTFEVPFDVAKEKKFSVEIDGLRFHNKGKETIVLNVIREKVYDAVVTIPPNQRIRIPNIKIRHLGDSLVLLVKKMNEEEYSERIFKRYPSLRPEGEETE